MNEKSYNAGKLDKMSIKVVINGSYYFVINVIFQSTKKPNIENC